MTAHLWAVRRHSSDDPGLALFYDQARRGAFPPASGEPETVSLIKVVHA